MPKKKGNGVYDVAKDVDTCTIYGATVWKKKTATCYHKK